MLTRMRVMMRRRDRETWHHALPAPGPLPGLQPGQVLHRLRVQPDSGALQAVLVTRDGGVFQTQGREENRREKRVDRGDKNP